MNDQHRRAIFLRHRVGVPNQLEVSHADAFRFHHEQRRIAQLLRQPRVQPNQRQRLANRDGHGEGHCPVRIALDNGVGRRSVNYLLQVVLVYVDGIR